jgi:hypothetical protein
MPIVRVLTVLVGLRIFLSAPNMVACNLRTYMCICIHVSTNMINAMFPNGATDGVACNSHTYIRTCIQVSIKVTKAMFSNGAKYGCIKLRDEDDGRYMVYICMHQNSDSKLNVFDSKLQVFR